MYAGVTMRRLLACVLGIFDHCIRFLGTLSCLPPAPCHPRSPVHLCFPPQLQGGAQHPAPATRSVNSCGGTVTDPMWTGWACRTPEPCATVAAAASNQAGCFCPESSPTAL